MKKGVFTTVLIGLLVGITSDGCNSESDEDLVNAHCGRCHLPPDPGLLPTATWEESVLPRMSYYLGLQSDLVAHPLSGLSMEEQQSINRHLLFPQKPVVSNGQWDRITRFYTEGGIKKDKEAVIRNHPGQTQFAERVISHDQKTPPIYTMVRWIDDESRLWVGDASGYLYRYSYDSDLQLESTHLIGRTPVEIYDNGSEQLVLDMGLIMPNDHKTGSLMKLKGSSVHTLYSGLKRPVDFLLLEDSTLILAEFGHMAGALSLWEDNMDRKVLAPYPGCIKILEEDLNNDGNSETIALFSQGQEGVLVCHDLESLRSCDRILELHPLFGASDMELVDMDGDGLIDILLASGDNADYSLVQKDYHGIYFFRNLGGFTFEEVDFIPMHGCTNIEVRDFDGDDDPDIISSAFFPVSVGESITPSLIFLKNEEGDFSIQEFEGGNNGRWLVMDSGDFDKDGDFDIILGSFTVHPAPISEESSRYWREQGTGLLLLENLNEVWGE